MKFLDWLLGPKCVMGCGARVFQKDLAWHYNTEHAGDPLAPEPVKE